MLNQDIKGIVKEILDACTDSAQVTSIGTDLYILKMKVFQ